MDRCAKASATVNVDTSEVVANLPEEASPIPIAMVQPPDNGANEEPDRWLRAWPSTNPRSRSAGSGFYWLIDESDGRTNTAYEERFKHPERTSAAKVVTTLQVETSQPANDPDHPIGAR